MILKEIKLLQTVRRNKSITGILLFFGIAYSLISLVNHYLFRTYAFDLGLFNNALFDYAHFRWNDYPLQKEFCPNPLADHFDLTPVLASPLYWIFGSYTLLIVQIAAILFGGYGVYKYVRARTELKFLPEIAALHFFCIFGIYSAISYDYHGSVVGSMMVPWFIHYFEKGKRGKYLLFFILILISREHMSLFAAFICIGLAMGNRAEPSKRNAAIILSAVSFIYFFGIIKYVMHPLDYPQAASEGFRHFRYSILGPDFKGMILGILESPLQTFKYFFLNHTDNSFYDGIKEELHVMILLSGGFVFFLYPRFFVMLIPIFAQKVYSDDIMKWGINYHYSIEFVPILSIALFYWFMKWKSELAIFIVSGFAVLVTIVATVSKFDKRKSIWYSPVTVKFYYAKHYKVSFDVGILNNHLELIPPDAKVSASTEIVPHVSFRKIIYQFPIVDDANYIVLLLAGNTYPLSESDFEKQVNQYKESPEWTVVVDENSTLILKKK